MIPLPVIQQSAIIKDTFIRWIQAQCLLIFDGSLFRVAEPGKRDVKRKGPKPTWSEYHVGFGPVRMEVRKRYFAELLDIQAQSAVTLVTPVCTARVSLAVMVAVIVASRSPLTRFTRDTSSVESLIEEGRLPWICSAAARGVRSRPVNRYEADAGGYAIAVVKSGVQSDPIGPPTRKR